MFILRHVIVQNPCGFLRLDIAKATKHNTPLSGSRDVICAARPLLRLLFQSLWLNVANNSNDDNACRDTLTVVGARITGA